VNKNYLNTKNYSIS